MRQWLLTILGIGLSACAAPYSVPMTASSGSEYTVNASPYAYGGGLPYSSVVSPWNSPYGFNSGYSGGNFSPKKGLTCDRDRHVCYDRYGVDYFETNKYLGSKSAKRSVKRYGEQAFIFAPQQGVVCDRRSQSCSDGNGLNATLTRKYFSKDDTRRVGAWTSADMFSPQAGVACNRTTQICSDNNGPNVDLTQLYLGRQAALDLANQQNQPAPLLAPVTPEPVQIPDVVAAPAPAPDEDLPAQAPQPDILESTPGPIPAAVAAPVAAPEPIQTPSVEPVPAMVPEPAPIPEPVVTAEPVPAASCEAETCP